MNEEQFLRQAIESTPGARARVVSVRSLGDLGALAADLEVDWLDPYGERQTATAHLWVPRAALTAGEPSPLHHQAGYEIADDGAAAHLAKGFVVSNPGAAPAGMESTGLWNPLFRGPNFDYAVLHVARSLPFVDPARVVIGGGSAGGYAALMVGIETFPVAAVLADHPVVNLGYEAAYSAANKELAATTADGLPVFPVLNLIANMGFEGFRLTYGTETDSPSYLAHSPVAHTELMTADVHIVASTADLLVPIDQISSEHVRARVGGGPEDGLTTNPSELAQHGASKTLAEAVPDAAFTVVPRPSEAPRFSITMLAPPPDAPVLNAGWPGSQWSVLVLEEGAPEPDLGHMKYVFKVQRDEARLAGLLSFPGSRLTLPKLRQLLKRAAGKEWLCPEHRHLDLPEAEFADVRRGLEAYLRLEGARDRLTDLAAQLEPEERSTLDLVTAPAISA